MYPLMDGKHRLPRCIQPIRCLALVIGLGGLMSCGTETVQSVAVCEQSSDCSSTTVCVRGDCIPIQQVDRDRDGVPDPVELELGSNPERGDTDGDGISDAEELTTDPVTRRWSAPDSDEDGVPDVLESNEGDRDDDGVVDAQDPCDQDPDCPVVGGTHPPCYRLMGEPCVAGVGQCSVIGRTACTEDEQDVVCLGEENAPTNEICDGADNDCDGVPDEDFPTLNQACLVGLGICERPGLVECNDAGDVECASTDGIGDRVPQPMEETCNGLDDDCDGRSDEAFPNLGQICERTFGTCQVSGVEVCDEENGTSVCQVEDNPDAQERCDGQDNDCDGQIDEAFPGLDEPCTSGSGECSRLGLRVCQADGMAAVCDAVPGQASGELCNGLDDDCDGSIDEGFAGLGDPCAIGQGACRVEGNIECLADGSGTFCPSIPGEPNAEACDGVDNDCDGNLDELPEVGQACSVGVGQCETEGTLICNPMDQALTCQSQPGQPIEELCDGIDNDCDGQTDEAYADLGTPCQVGDDICIVEGVRVCRVDRRGTECGADPNGAARELCDNQDNDCDGRIDEALDLGEACFRGEGECRSPGTFICDEAGGVVCDVVPVQGVPERCDNIDNDCDFAVDENYRNVGSICVVGQGECAESGRFICAENGDGVRCDIEPSQPNAEICDGLDNDCDGLFDENFDDLNARCEAGLGRCLRRGRRVCGDDGAEVVCSATPAPPNVETCNQIDDDCDGQTDETFADLGTQCSDGVGACQRDGQIVCTNDARSVTCSVTAGDPSNEVCDTVDNDCDGDVDEGYSGTCELTVELLATSNYGTCIQQVDPEIRCWGDIGRPPARLSTTAIQAGGERMCALTTEGLLQCWGQGDAPPVDLGVIRRFSVGSDGHVCTLNPMGSVRCFGGNGRLGDVPEGPFTEISSGYEFSCGLRDGGSVLCWGQDEFGVLNAPDRLFSRTASANTATCGLLQADGSIDCWGQDIAGQLDPPDGSFSSIKMGGYTGCALDPEGRLNCWGSNQHGQATPPAGQFSFVAMGAAHGCAIRRDGVLMCWGAGSPDDGDAFPHFGQSTIPE